MNYPTPFIWCYFIKTGGHKMASILSHQTTKQTTTPEDIPKGLESNYSLGWKMLFIAFFLGFISLWMNVSFGYSLGTDTTSKLAMAGEYLSFDLAKLVALTIIGFAWAKRNHVIAAVFVVVFVLTVGFSLISAQSFMASLLHGQKVERVMQSAAYQDNQNAKQRAQAKVEELAISSSEINEAKAKVERLERQQAAAQATYEQYASRGNYPTRARQAGMELEAIESQIEKQQAIVNQGSAYNGALTNLDRLENKKITNIAGESVENAGFSSVAFALGVEVKVFIAKLLLFMAAASEIITTMFFFYAGHVMGLKVRKYSHQEMMQMHLQMAQEEKEKAALAIHVKQALEVEPITTTAVQETPKVDPESIEKVKLPKAEKKALGTEYQCFEDGCNNRFTARTVWHKRCDECREKNSKEHRRAKGGSS